jgi:hypothetical protein
MVMMAAAGAWWAQAESTGDRTPAPDAHTPPSIERPVAAERARPPSAQAGDAALAATPVVAAANANPAPQTSEASLAVPSAAVARAGDAPAVATPRAPAGSSRTNEQRVAPANPAHPKSDAAAVRRAATAMPAVDPPAAEPTQPSVTVAVVTRNPREQCAGRHLLAMHRCLMRECAKPEFQAHRECQKARDIDARGRSLGDL